ncbi:5-bromo-4-chloroindolyl phosphate hydrolysis family protein [Leptospira idonii]|uniref:DUF4870 domain-containing protein n=1 Tax=Leptospira idonii TaxID=1193500 RepID=A0A4R9LXL2_9LEPT|nr:5-bromo-4-chloroindolyl phosphate hydrolysis family protein [Leptospira idonii]TGN17121.1 hypothetical protein EHS15_18265 [Leptospira idonii]
MEPSEIQSSEEKRWARRAHLTTLLVYPLALLPFPFAWEALGAVALPFLLWISRPSGSYSSRQALEAMYLQTLVGLGYFGFGQAFSEDRVLFVFSYVFVAFLHLLFLGFGVFKTTIGKPHNYPFSFIPALFASKTRKKNWNDLKKRFQNGGDFDKFKAHLEKIDSVKQTIDAEAKLLPDANLQSLANQFSVSLEDLKLRLLEDPSSYKKAEQYLNYFPETTSKILSQYNRVSRGGEADNEKRKTELEQLLQEVIKTTKEVRGKLKADETLNLDVEITAMKKNIDFGGY